MSSVALKDLKRSRDFKIKSLLKIKKNKITIIPTKVIENLLYFYFIFEQFLAAYLVIGSMLNNFFFF